MSHIILTGATGLAGSAVLSHCLNSPLISKITILSRRPVEQGIGNPKVNVVIHEDFKTYSSELLETLADTSGCVWAQGISAIGMKEIDYTEITINYPLAAAQAFATIHPDRNFNFIYISGDRADPSGKYPQMWARIKGRAETLLLDLTKKHPAFSVYNVRPSFMDPGPTWTAQRPKAARDRISRAVAVTLNSIIPSQSSPLVRLSEVWVALATGDGRPVPEGKGVLEGGRTLLNTALRRMAGL